MNCRRQAWDEEGEKVIVVEARQLLEFARASDRGGHT